MIEVENLKKTFRKKVVLYEIGFKTQGRIVGLLGPNGSGKTTLLRILAGIIKRYDGNIIFKNLSGNTINPKECKIGYLPQNFGMIKNYTLYEHLKYFACMKNIPNCDWEENIQEVLTSGHLGNVQNVKCGKLSGGMIRRAGIAQALLGMPDVILLDEPTVGLDPEERIRFQNTINNYKHKSTILVSTHILDDVEEICDEIIVLNKGKVLYCGETNALAMLAKNRVFTMSKQESMHWQEYGINIKNYYENDTEKVRFLYLRDGEYNNPKARKEIANVEDGYMYLLKKYRKI